MYEVDKTRTHDDSPSHDEKYRGTHSEEELRFKEYYAEIRGGDIRGVRAHVLRDGEALSPEIAADQVGVQHSGEGRARGEREEDLRRRLRP